MHIELSRPGNFLVHREITTEGGAPIEADDEDLTLIPVTEGFPASGCQSIWLYWTGTSPADEDADRLVLIPLVRDGINNVWVQMAAVPLVYNTRAEIDVFGASCMYIRIDGVETVATPIKILVAKAQNEFESGL